MNIKYSKLMLVTLAAAALSACGSSGDGGDSVTPENNNPVNKPHTPAAPKYFKISAAGDKLDSVDIKSQADAAKSAGWDVGFSGTKIYINSGDSGKGTVQAALAAAQTDFYDKGKPNASVFTNATAEQEGKTAWESVSDLAEVKKLEFKQPKDAAVIGGSWYNYDHTTHAVSANKNNGYLLRSSTGDSYAKMRVTGMKNQGRDITGLTIEFAVQAKDATAYGAPSSKDYDLSSNKCIDFDTQTAVACTGKNWDVELKGYDLWLNSPVNGGGKGALGMGAAMDATKADWTEFTAGNTGALAIAQHYKTDAAAGTFETNPWYVYDLQGQHKIWPNFRVYVLRTGKARSYKYYKFQIQSRYDNKGKPLEVVKHHIAELK